MTVAARNAIRRYIEFHTIPLTQPFLVLLRLTDHDVAAVTATKIGDDAWTYDDGPYKGQTHRGVRGPARIIGIA